MLEVLYYSAKFGGARISPAAGMAKNGEFLSVCLSVPLDSGRFVVVHPCSTLSDCCQLATTLNAEVQNTTKIGVFANRGRQNKPIQTKLCT